MREIAVEFVYCRQQKMKNFHSKDDTDGKLWMEVTVVTSLDDE